MKKTFLFLLLTSFLWSGVSFAQEGGPDKPSTQYCTTDKCITTMGEDTSVNDANFEICNEHLKTANTNYDTAATKADAEIKTINDEIEKATDAYTQCKIKPENAAYLLMIDGETLLNEKCNTQDSDVQTATGNIPYEDFITAQKAEKAKWFKSKTEFADEVACAKVSYSQIMLNRLGDLTSSFDIGLLNVGNEASLDIVDNVKGENNIFNRILKLLTQVLGTFAVLMLIIGAFYMITSQGDESQLQKGKNVFFYTIIGLLIAFMSFITVQFVISIIFTSTG